MKDNGLGTVADILFLTLLISISCTTLIGFSSITPDRDNPKYASKMAQNTLQAFQNLRVKKIECTSYKPYTPVNETNERTIRRKTIIQLISEDVILNPKWRKDGHLISLNTNRELSDKLSNLLKKSLREFIGKRFGFVLNIRTEPVSISKGKSVLYRKTIEDVKKNSEKICSETIKLDIILPFRWTGKPERIEEGPKLTIPDFPAMELIKEPGKTSLESLRLPVGKITTLKITLELWSK